MRNSPSCYLVLIFLTQSQQKKLCRLLQVESWYFNISIPCWGLEITLAGYIYLPFYKNTLKWIFEFDIVEQNVYKRKA